MDSSHRAWEQASELPDDDPAPDVDTPGPISWSEHWALREQLSATLGAVRWERDLLVRKILAMETAITEARGDMAWRDLLRTARWMQAREERRP